MFFKNKKNKKMELKENELRKNFFRQLKPYEDANLVERVYVGKDMCILNFCDFFYLGCPYFSAEQGLLFGLMISCKTIEQNVRDEMVLFETLKSFDAKTLDKTTVDLSKANLENLIDFCEKEKKKRETPTKHIDKMLEQKIKQEYKSYDCEINK